MASPRCTVQLGDGEGQEAVHEPAGIEMEIPVTPPRGEEGKQFVSQWRGVEYR